MQRINFDSICATADVDIDGVQCLFDSTTQFISETGFSFPDAKKVYLEPERNIYIVERSGGKCYQGADQPELTWLVENIQHIKQVAQQINESRVPARNWRNDRNFNLAITDWMVTRHVEQTELLITTTLTAEQYGELLNFRQALRSLTDENHTFPQTPTFVQLG